MDKFIPTTLNDVYIEGNLLDDPQFRETGSGPFCNFEVAIDDRERTIRIGVKTYGKVARSCRENLAKGSRVMVKGRLTESTWENGHGRQRRIEINARYIKFLDIRGVR